MLWAPSCMHASLRTPSKRAQTHSRSFKAAQGHCFDLVPCYLISLPLEKKRAQLLTACCSSVFSPLIFMEQPTQRNLCAGLVVPPPYKCCRSNWPGVLHHRERRWEPDRACWKANRDVSKCQVTGCTAKSRPNLVMLLRVNLFIRQHLSTTGIFWSCWVCVCVCVFCQRKYTVVG